MSDFHHAEFVDIPQWAHCLRGPYWRIRVEGRNKSLRRKNYRIVEKMKFEMVEAGHDVELVNAICRYLMNFRKTSVNEVQRLLVNPNPQMSLFF